MIWLAYKNETTRSALYAGWIPVLSAMIISSIGGLILKETVDKLQGIAIYTPIINGKCTITVEPNIFLVRTRFGHFFSTT